MDLRQFQSRLAERVKAPRQQRGLRQEDLENFGLSWKTVQKVEYGITDPKASTLLKLSRAFGVTLTELLSDVAAKPKTRRRMQRRQVAAPRPWIAPRARTRTADVTSVTLERQRLRPVNSDERGPP